MSVHVRVFIVCVPAYLCVCLPVSLCLYVSLSLSHLTHMAFQTRERYATLLDGWFSVHRVLSGVRSQAPAVLHCLTTAYVACTAHLRGHIAGLIVPNCTAHWLCSHSWPPRTYRVLSLTARMGSLLIWLLTLLPHPVLDAFLNKGAASTVTLPVTPDCNAPAHSHAPRHTAFVLLLGTCQRSWTRCSRHLDGNIALAA
jgi:hypothetical protein